jgi:hypothetical protein
MWFIKNEGDKFTDAMRTLLVEEMSSEERAFHMKHRTVLKKYAWKYNIQRASKPVKIGYWFVKLTAPVIGNIFNIVNLYLLYKISQVIQF